MKILFLDIETSPHLSFHWRRWQENIPARFTLEESRVICAAWKWQGQKTVSFAAEWQRGGAERMFTKIYEALSAADVVIGYNSKKFDIKKLNTEFIRLGWSPPAPFQQVDLLQQVKKNFSFSSNRLDDVLADLQLNQKIETTGMELWIDVWSGDKAARTEMQEYNIGDVKVTEELYDWILGWITPHPNWGLYVDDRGADEPTCITCGSHNMRKHKKRPTKVGLFQQWHCQDCGAYHRGRKNLKTGGTKNGVLA